MVIVLKVVGTILIFVPVGLQAFDLPKTSWSRAAEVVLAMSLGLALFRHGPGIVPRSVLHVPVAAMVVVSAIASLTASDQTIALHGEWDRYLGLTFVIDMAVLYVAAAVSLRTDADQKLVASSIAGAAAVVAMYALLQRAGVDPFTVGLTSSQPATARPYSTFGNPDPLGQFLAAVAVGSLALATLSSARARWLAVGHAAFLLTALGSTGTRGAALGLAAGGVAVLVGMVTLKMGRRMIIAGAVVAAVMLAALLASPLGARLGETLGGQGLQPRLLIFDAALRAFADRPILGHGPDNFGVIYPLYQQPGSARVHYYATQNSAHSLPLQAAVATGVPGLVALVAFAASSIVVARGLVVRHPRLALSTASGVAAYWAHGLVTVGSVSVDWIPFLAAGSLVAVGATTRAGEAVRSSPRWSTAIVLASGVALAMFVGRGAFEANLYAWRANSALLEGRASEAERWARAAVHADPGRVQYWNLLGRSNDALGASREAVRAYERALSIQPRNSKLWQNLARARSRLAALEAENGAPALDAARRAIAAAPNESEPYYVMGVVAHERGAYRESIEAAIRSMALRSQFTNEDTIAAASALQMSDKSEALAMVTEALRYRESALLHVVAADCALRIGDLAIALAHVRRALEIDPANADALRLKGRLGQQ